MIRLRLDSLPMRRPARIVAIDWEALRPAEARRLRELGFDEHVTIELVHQGPFGRDPIAARVGRMTIAIRRAVAAAITIEPLTAQGAAHVHTRHAAIAAE
ncbi:MAG: ferrous iron transport protein A [Sphingomonadaceae bacterium]|nr:ferrous iron transport protein A [Sphingomonadaceae bacterium]